MHFHLAPRVDGEYRRVGGPGGPVGREAGWLIAGLATLAPALMAFGTRSPHSFVRLTQAREAPDRVTWGWHNRRALIRIPVIARNEEGDAATAEQRGLT